MDKRFFVAFAIILSLAISSLPAAAIAQDAGDLPGDATLILFGMESCPHCKAEKAWLADIGAEYPGLSVVYYELGDNLETYNRLCEEYNVSVGYSVPRTFIGSKVFVGFDEGEGELVYNPATHTYIGYANQIENAILQCLNLNCTVMRDRAIELSASHPLAAKLIAENPGSVATTVLVNHSYLVGWWTPERIKSSLDYPNLVVYVSDETGAISGAQVPSSRIEGLEKPIQGLDMIHVAMLSVLLAYLVAYLVFRNRVKLDCRYWAVGFLAIVIVFLFILALTIPGVIVERFAKRFPFPVFVFIVALADGFNPCAFTVLIVLLSLLTHTKSRRKMTLIGSVFILMSGVMYFLFISFLAVAGSWIFFQYKDLLFMAIGLVVFAAGAINVKDFFFFKKGLSLGISDENRGRIMKEAGKIVRNVERAEDHKSLAFALLATAGLAAVVNLVELGCTAILPTAYLSALFNVHGSEIGFYHYIYNAFYSLVYVLPLFAILANFLYTFKSDRLSEDSARKLKLAGGIVMLVLGVVLMLRPELLSFG